MWIKKIHIDDFGKFSDYDLELESSFTILHGDNEDGKSTLMAFIQMMFYGHSGRSQDISQNPRKKYAPWNGRDMKGYILFEENGTSYRLERHFGKSDTTDVIKVWNIDTVEEVKMPGRKDPGEVFFSLGSEAFERSVFIGQSGSVIQSKGKKDEITEKLLNMVTTGDENTSYQKVSELLKVNQEQLVSRSRKIGVIDKMEKSLEELEKEKYQAIQDEEEKATGELEIQKMKEDQKKLEEEKSTKEEILLLKELQQQQKKVERSLKRKLEINDLESNIDEIKEGLHRDQVTLDKSFVETTQELDQKVNKLAYKVGVTKENYEDLFAKKTSLIADTPAKIEEDHVAKVKNSLKEAAHLEKEQDVIIQKIKKVKEYLEKESELEMIKKSADEAKVELSALESKLEIEEKKLEEIDTEFQESAEEKNLKEDELRELEKENYQLTFSLEAKKSEESSAKERHKEWIEELDHEIEKASGLEKYEKDVKTAASKPMVLIGAILLIILGVIFGLIISPYLYGLSFVGLALLIIFLIKNQKKSSKHQVIAPKDIEDLIQRRDKRAEENKKEEQGLLKDIDELEEKLKENIRRIGDLKKVVTELAITVEKQKANLDDQRNFLGQVKLSRESNSTKLENVNLRVNEQEESLESFELKGSEELREDLQGKLDQIKEKINKLKEESQKILQANDVTNIDDLVHLKYIYDSFNENVRELEVEIKNEKSKLENIKEQFEEKEKELLSKVSLYEKVASLAEVPSKLNQLREKLNELEGFMRTLDFKKNELSEEEKIKSIDELKSELEILAGKSKCEREGPLQNLEDIGLEEVKKEVASLQREFYTLGNTITKNESILKEKYRERKNVSQVENEIHEVKSKIEELNKEYQALVIAGKVLGDAFTEIQRSFGPKLNQTTSKIFSKLTHGKYQNLQVKRDFDIIIEDEKEQSLREWKFLSGGTMDQAYLSLRLSVATLLKKDQENLPLFLDDIFTQYDDARAKEALNFLYEYQKKGSYQQIILFTCHERIVNWAKKEFKEISLQSVLT